jgi:cell division protein YceG involved in septum cleavage
MKKTALALLLIFVLSAFASAADTYHQGKILKWEDSTYAAKKKEAKNWVVYQLETDTGTYSIARQKETKPQMQAGDVVQYAFKGKNDIKVIDARGKTRDYRIIGQSAAPAR